MVRRLLVGCAIVSLLLPISALAPWTLALGDERSGSSVEVAPGAPKLPGLDEAADARPAMVTIHISSATRSEKIAVSPGNEPGDAGTSGRRTYHQRSRP